MKPLVVIAILFGRTWLCAADLPVEFMNTQPPMPFPQAPRAWLGLKVAKPDAAITAHLPALPPGIGFVIRSVDESGPVQAAGLQAMDLLWKLGDQMLVNEGQLAALLRLAKSGDEVTLTGFRAGKPLEVKLTLGVAPIQKRPLPVDLLDSTILPGECGGPIRVVNVAERVAGLRGESLEQVALASTANAQRLFRLPVDVV